MTDPTSQLKTATRRAKSDVANKLISMFLHELSRKVCRRWGMRVESDEYAAIVRRYFENRCPYCLLDLTTQASIVEHLDGMNRYRVGLHIPGNVVVACKRCNSEKRRDDSLLKLTLAESGWASFLSHNGIGCKDSCRTCAYWASVWPDEGDRMNNLAFNLERLRRFRAEFVDLETTLAPLERELPLLLTKLYSDCQAFAETEIRTMLDRF